MRITRAKSGVADESFVRGAGADDARIGHGIGAQPTDDEGQVARGRPSVPSSRTNDSKLLLLNNLATFQPSRLEFGTPLQHFALDYVCRSLRFATSSTVAKWYGAILCAVEFDRYKQIPLTLAPKSLVAVFIHYPRITRPQWRGSRALSFAVRSCTRAGYRRVASLDA